MICKVRCNESEVNPQTGEPCWGCMDLNRRDEENAMSIARLIVENISKERMAMDLAEIIVRTANRLEDSSLDDQIQKKQVIEIYQNIEMSWW